MTSGRMTEGGRSLVHSFKAALFVILLVASVLILLSYTSIGRGQTDVDAIRVLCVILTMEKDLESKAAAVNKTWVKRCHRHFYILTTKRQQADFLNLDIPDTRNSLVHKTRKAYETVYDKYINDFDWILKADDDTYVVVENLKYLLSHYSASEPGYLGYHFKVKAPSGYMSGGAGYVMSNCALRQLVTEGFRKNKCPIEARDDDPEQSEDLETGLCLHKVGVPVLSSLDIQGRETFHPYPPEQHLVGALPSYLYSWSKNNVVEGENCCSRYAVSFHYLSPRAIYLIDFLLYKTTVHGLQVQDPGANSSVFRIGKVV